MAFGLNLSTLGNLGRAASKGIADNAAFNEQQRLIGGQDADRESAKLVMKAAVDPTPENLKAAMDSFNSPNVSPDLVSKATPILQQLSQLPQRQAQAQVERQAGADRSMLELQDKARQGARVGLEQLIRPQQEANMGITPQTPSVTVPTGGDGFTLSPGQQRFGPSGQPVAGVPPKPDSQPFTLSPGQQRFTPEGTPIANVPGAPKKPTRLVGTALKERLDLGYLKRSAEALRDMLLDPEKLAVLDKFQGSTLGHTANRFRSTQGGVGVLGQAANVVLPESMEFQDQPEVVTQFENIRTDLMDAFARNRTGAAFPEHEQIPFKEIISDQSNTAEITRVKINELLKRVDRALADVYAQAGVSPEEADGLGDTSSSAGPVDLSGLERRAISGDVDALAELERAAEDSDEAYEVFKRVMLRNQ